MVLSLNKKKVRGFANRSEKQPKQNLEIAVYDIGGLARPFDWFVVGCEESFESGESVEED